MKPLILDPEAEAELAAALLYYEECQRGLGAEFLAEFEAASERAQKNPLAYEIHFAHFRKCNLARFPYGIVYSIESDFLYGVAVMNLHRKPFYWRKRVRR